MVQDDEEDYYDEDTELADDEDLYSEDSTEEDEWDESTEEEVRLLLCVYGINSTGTPKNTKAQW